MLAEIPEKLKSKFGVVNVDEAEILEAKISDYRTNQAQTRLNQVVTATLEDSDYDSETEEVEIFEADDSLKMKLDVCQRVFIDKNVCVCVCVYFSNADFN